jgi:hypothetical protein
MNDLDTERFIDEVKKRKAIWDTSSEGYKNINLKKSQWMEVCVVFYPDFEGLDAKEKANIGKFKLLLLFIIDVTHYYLA